MKRRPTVVLVIAVALLVQLTGCDGKKVNEIDIAPPPVPENVSAAAVSSTEIQVSWSAVSANDLDHYNIYDGTTKVAERSGTSYIHTGLAAGSTHIYTVSSADGTGNVSARSASSAASTPASDGDILAPSVPANFTASAASANLVDLAWSASTDNVGVTGYEVFRDGSSIETVNGTTYQDTSVSAGTNYIYKVRAVDGAGNMSNFSDESAANTPAIPDTTGPAAPGNLAAAAASESQINLSWDSATDPSGIKHYNIYRGGALIGNSAGASYNDTGLDPATPYCYQVTAVDNADNEGGKSAELCENTMPLSDTTAPGIPQDVVTTADPGMIRLAWTASTDNAGGTGVAGYRIYDSAGALLFTAPSASADVTGLAPGQEYCFSVSAVDLAGNESGKSSPFACAIIELPACDIGKALFNPFFGYMVRDDASQGKSSTALLGVMTSPNITLYAGENETTIQTFSGQMAGQRVLLNTAGPNKSTLDLIMNGTCDGAKGTFAVDGGSSAQVFLRMYKGPAKETGFLLEGKRDIHVNGTLAASSVPFTINPAGVLGFGNGSFVFYDDPFIGKVKGLAIGSYAWFFPSYYDEKVKDHIVEARAGSLATVGSDWQVSDTSTINSYLWTDLFKSISFGNWGTYPEKFKNPNVIGDWIITFTGGPSGGSLSITSQSSVWGTVDPSLLDGTGAMIVGSDTLPFKIYSANKMSMAFPYDGVKDNFVIVVPDHDMTAIGCGISTTAMNGITDGRYLSGTYKSVDASSTVCFSGDFTAERQWYDVYGSVCGTGEAKPGCNFHSTGEKITMKEDPYYPTHLLLKYDVWIYVDSWGATQLYVGYAWKGPTGILYDEYGRSLN